MKGQVGEKGGEGKKEREERDRERSGWAGIIWKRAGR